MRAAIVLLLLSGCIVLPVPPITPDTPDAGETLPDSGPVSSWCAGRARPNCTYVGCAWNDADEICVAADAGN